MPMGSGSILLRSTSSPRTSNSMFGRSEGLEPAAFLARPRARLICCMSSPEGAIDEEAGSDRDPIRADGSLKLDLRDEDAGGLRFDLAEIHLVAPEIQFDYSAEMKG